MVEMSEEKFAEYTKLIEKTTMVLYSKETTPEKVEECLDNLQKFYEKYPFEEINDLISQLLGKKSVLQCTPMKNLICKIKKAFAQQIDKNSTRLKEVEIKSTIRSWGNELTEKYENASIWIPMKSKKSFFPPKKPEGKFYQLNCGLVVSEEIAKEFPDAKEYNKKWEIALFY